MDIKNNLLSPLQTSGEQINLKATNEKHFGFTNPTESGKDFSKMLFDSIDQVNDIQNEANNLSVKSVYYPGEVEAHEVSIALAKANMSLSLVKNVVDKSIQAYKDIINIR